MNTPFDDEQMQRALEPFERHHDRLRTELMASLPADVPEAPRTAPPVGWVFWTGVSPMKRRFLQFAMPVAAAIVLAVTFLWPAPHGSSVALADAINRLRTAHTVTCRMFTYKQGQLFATADLMCLSDRHQRVTTSDGIIYVQDGNEGKLLALDPARKTARTLDTMPTAFELYKLITSFRDGTETSLGAKTIDGRAAVGFGLPGAAGNTSMWVDAKTGALVQIETESQDPHGNVAIVMMEIMKDFVLDAPLDESLFSVEIPKGYDMGEVHAPALDRLAELQRMTKAVMAAKKIANACIMFAEAHAGQWPESLESLKAQRIDANALVNPRQPEAAIGWVYVRPAKPWGQFANPGETILIHESLTTWGEGIIVSFADGHAELMKDQRFQKLLAQ